MDENFAQSVTDKANNLIGDLNVAIEYIGKLKVRERLVKEAEDKVSQEVNTISKVKLELKGKYEAIEQEKVEIQASRDDLTARSVIVNKKEDDLAKREEEHSRNILILDGEKRKLEEDKEKLRQNEVAVAKLDTVLADIQMREAAIKKEIALDRQRKESLDHREAQIEADQKRVAKLLNQ